MTRKIGWLYTASLFIREFRNSNPEELKPETHL